MNGNGTVNCGMWAIFRKYLKLTVFLLIFFFLVHFQIECGKSVKIELFVRGGLGIRLGFFYIRSTHSLEV